MFVYSNIYDKVSHFGSPVETVTEYDKGPVVLNIAKSSLSPGTPRIQFLIACGMPNPLILHTICDQELGGGDAWKRGYAKGMQCAVCIFHFGMERER